ncbi:MAG: hypothetical protein FVQ81_15935 [Candidatus Glassbacteria bacterium]|nr:hypothetical protein [Candidatus Glassbacteria bacterium]
MTGTATKNKSGVQHSNPGLFIILRPRDDAYSILRRVSRASASERTAKDFVDFFGNLSVMVHFGPLSTELVDDEDRWRELVPRCGQGLDAEREIYTGGSGSQQFMIVYLTDKATGKELPRWKELVKWIVERFY